VAVSVAATDGGGVLLERDESLTTLSEVLAGVRSGSEGWLVLVGGEAGVGKTALLRAFCERQPKSVRILWGSCEPLRTPRPLGPLLDVAEAVGGEFEELVAGAGRPHDVAFALLRALRGRYPTVLVLEDVHWADEATLDVLTLLAPRVASAPALVLASHRDDELERSQQLRVVLAQVGGRGRLRVLPLSEGAVSVLAEPYGVDGQRLYSRTGGNPFFVVEVLAAGGEQLPATVRDAVLARAARLSAPARRLLEAAAVVPGQVEVWLLEALAGELVGRLEETQASGMLSGSGSQVGFRHQLERLAIEGSISPERRTALHRQALAALTARDADYARLMHHAEAAWDGEAVLRWAPLAAERARAAGAHREAAAQYASALNFADRLPLGRRAELLQARADECYMSDQLEAAIEAQQEALERYRRLGDQRGEGNALRSLSRLLGLAYRPEADSLALKAVELLERFPPGHELAMAYGLLSQGPLVYEQRDEVTRWGTRALELATRIDDTEAVVYALENIGLAELQAGADEGQAKMERALALAQQNGLEDFVGRGFFALVKGCLRLRRLDRARRYLDAGLEYCGQRGLDTWRLYLLGARARVELNCGHWEQAGQSAALALRDPRSAPVARVYASAARGLLRARRGDPDVSEPLEAAHTVVHPTRQLEWITLVAASRAEAAWLTGDTAAVEPLTSDALALALEYQEPWSTGELAYWRWQAGLRDELPAVQLAGPYALSIAGEWAKAAERWQDIGCPYEAALALADGDQEPALRQAHDQLQALGARPAAAIVARRLRQRGARGVPRGPRPRTRENPAGLTARELEVLPLLADGLRNAQIARRLVVSEKTVDHHVSSILRKLEVRTRAEAAAEAVRLGLTAKPSERGSD
jgi:DNA-binding CsgD family transcriptional regulator